MRKKIVAGNWKMNMSCHEATALFSQLLEFTEEIPENTQVIILPPSLYIKDFAKKVSSSKIISIGAQNCHSENEGAFTGEISAEMLKSVGAAYCIIGHSERRTLFGETDEIINKKILNAIAVSLNVIFCIGETEDIRNNNDHFEFIKSQLINGLKNIPFDRFSKIILAYEPVWAIGTGKTASPDQAQEMHHFIRKAIHDLYGHEISENVHILYGGSCNPDNAKQLFSCADVDGGLIGGASLKAQSFIAVIKATN